MTKVLKGKPKALFVDNKYCPGCGHGTINRLVAEVLEEGGMDKKALAAIAVGCSSLMPDTFAIDCVQAQHGRAAAVAVGMKRCRPDNLVFTYQGDGDALAIGFSETMYSAIRDENITIIFVNNANFGMTGGQMAPTTLLGQKTTTSPKGRNTGHPLDFIKLMSTLDVGYLARGSLNTNNDILKTKSYIKKAFDIQMNKQGFSFVEIITTCPTNWGVSPLEALNIVKERTLPVYNLGEFKDRGAKNV